MSTKLAVLEVTLPPALAQIAIHAKRVVTITGSVADGSQDVAITFTGPLTIKAPVDSQVTIGVAEVLANGKTHAPVVFKVIPSAIVEPIPPDASQFAAKVTGVEDSP